MSCISLQESEDYNCTYPADSNKQKFPFDYTNENSVSIIREKEFKKGAKGFDNWIQCSVAVITCCDNMEDIYPGKESETVVRVVLYRRK